MSLADQEAEEEVQEDAEPTENKEFAEQDVKSEVQSAADNEVDETCLLTTKG